MFTSLKSVSVARMGMLTEASLDQLLGQDCPACRSTRLHFRSFCDVLLPLLGGEPVGAITWVYDGEKFVDGVFAAIDLASAGDSSTESDSSMASDSSTASDVDHQRSGDRGRPVDVRRRVGGW